MRTNLVRLAGFAAGLALGRLAAGAIVWLWREEIGQRVWALRNAPDRPWTARVFFPETSRAQAEQDRVLGDHWYRAQPTAELDRRLAELRTAMLVILREAGQDGTD